MRHPITRAAFLALGLASAGALAQTPSEPLKARPTDPNMPAQENTVPEKIRPEAPASTGSTADGRGNLSDRLERSEGVLRPGGDATGTVISPPGSTNMPVITPQGTSPTDSVQPK